MCLVLYFGLHHSSCSESCVLTRLGVRSACSTSHSSRENRKVKNNFINCISFFRETENVCLFIFILYWKNYSTRIRGHMITVIIFELWVILLYEGKQTNKQTKTKTKQKCKQKHINSQEFCILVYFHVYMLFFCLFVLFVYFLLQLMIVADKTCLNLKQ